MSKLYFRYGAMNSGKTTALLQVAHNYEEKGMRVLIMKPSIDTKGNNKIVSRLGVSRKVDVLISKKDNLTHLIINKNHEREIDCILIDEVQFLDPEQIDQLMIAVKQTNIPVICYGLRTDFMMNGFKGSKRLLSIAHSIEELKTICECGKKSIANIKLVNNKPCFEGEQIEIDDNESIKYASVCFDCYYNAVRFDNNIGDFKNAVSKIVSESVDNIKKIFNPKGE